MLLKMCRELEVEYLIGDMLIDGEHKQIIDTACAFSEGIESGTLSYRDALNMLRVVLSHINTHFQHEELLLKLYNADSADIELHKREHVRLKIILTAAMENLREQEQEDAGFKEACITLAGNLYDLITNHILTVDKQTLLPCVTKQNKFYSLFARKP